MRERLTNWATRHPAMVALSAAIAFLAFVGYLRNIEYWRKYFDSAFQYAVDINAKTGEVSSKGWFFYTVLLLLTTFVVVVSLFIQSEVRRRETIKAKDTDESKAYKTLQGMMRAAARIRDQLNPAPQLVRKAFDSVRVVYLISKDFSAAVRREYAIRAVKGPVHFWAVSSQATSYADPADYFLDIDFRVLEEDKVVYLPTKNDRLSKGVCLYFLPQLEVGEPSRKVTLSYRWPGLLKQLKVKGEEEIGVTLDSAEAMKSFQLEVYLEENSGGNLECYRSGPSQAEESLNSAKYSENQWPGWIYTVRNAPAGRIKLAIMLRLKTP